MNINEMPANLRSLANWHDMFDGQVRLPLHLRMPNDEVQRDLRDLADWVENALRVPCGLVWEGFIMPGVKKTNKIAHVCIEVGSHTVHKCECGCSMHLMS